LSTNTSITKADFNRVVFNKVSSNKVNHSPNNKSSRDAPVFKDVLKLIDVDSAQAATNKEDTSNKVLPLKLLAKELWDPKLLTKESLKAMLLTNTSLLVPESSAKNS